MIFSPQTNAFQTLTDIGTHIRDLKRGSLASRAKNLIQSAATNADAVNRNSFDAAKATYENQWQPYQSQWKDWEQKFSQYQDAKEPLLQFVQDQFVDAYANPTGTSRDNRFYSNINLSGHYGGENPGLEYNGNLDAKLRAIDDYKAANFRDAVEITPPTAPKFDFKPQQTDIRDDENLKYLDRLNAEQRRVNTTEGAKRGANLVGSGWMQRVKADKMLAGVSDVAADQFRKNQDARNADVYQALNQYGTNYQDYLNNKDNWEREVVAQDQYDGAIGNTIPQSYAIVPTARQYGQFTPYWGAEVPQALRNEYNYTMDNARATTVGLLGSGNVWSNRPAVTPNQFTGADWGGSPQTQSVPSTTPFQATMAATSDPTQGQGATWSYLDKLNRLEEIERRMAALKRR